MDGNETGRRKYRVSMAQLAYAEMWIVLFILSWMDVLFDVHHAKENGKNRDFNITRSIYLFSDQNNNLKRDRT